MLGRFFSVPCNLGPPQNHGQLASDLSGGRGQLVADILCLCGAQSSDGVPARKARYGAPFPRQRAQYEVTPHICWDTTCWGRQLVLSVQGYVQDTAFKLGPTSRCLRRCTWMYSGDWSPLIF